jgi:hypothetical protein
MSRAGKLNSSGLTYTKSTIYKSDVGIVLDVILDDTHERVTDGGEGDGESKRTGLVGAIIVRPANDNTTPDKDLRPIRPYDAHYVDLPIIGETVQIITVGGLTFYKRLSMPNLNRGSAVDNKMKDTFTGSTNEVQEGGDYREASSTGISGTSGGDDRESTLGEYFETTQVNALKYYEGDKLVQSRFGQSLRFSGYNNSENALAPTIILRNRQNTKSLDELKEGSLTEENVVEDGSTIAITSGDYLLGWTPGTEDGPFDTEPVYYEPPSELKGTDQILINSGRIILSSKDSEMIFFSKGNFSIVSDGLFTLDNGNDGASIDLNGEYRTTTNDNNMYFLGGSGEIYLNTESNAEPLVRGETLLGLLEELIDEINKQIFNTPCGPTAPGPTNAPAFNSIKGRLSEFLSTLNYTE